MAKDGTRRYDATLLAWVCRAPIASPSPSNAKSLRRSGRRIRADQRTRTGEREAAVARGDLLADREVNT